MNRKTVIRYAVFLVALVGFAQVGAAQAQTSNDERGDQILSFVLSSATQGFFSPDNVELIVKVVDDGNTADSESWNVEGKIGAEIFCFINLNWTEEVQHDTNGVLGFLLWIWDGNP